MKRRRRNARAEHLRQMTAHADPTPAGATELDDLDLRVILQALDDRQRRYPAQPLGIAAERVALKIRRNMARR